MDQTGEAFLGAGCLSALGTYQEAAGVEPAAVAAAAAGHLGSHLYEDGQWKTFEDFLESSLNPSFKLINHLTQSAILG